MYVSDSANHRVRYIGQASPTSTRSPSATPTASATVTVTPVGTRAALQLYNSAGGGADYKGYVYTLAGSGGDTATRPPAGEGVWGPDITARPFGVAMDPVRRRVYYLDNWGSSSMLRYVDLSATDASRYGRVYRMSSAGFFAQPHGLGITAEGDLLVRSLTAEGGGGGRGVEGGGGGGVGGCYASSPSTLSPQR